MRSVSSGLQAKMNAGLAQLCHIAKITRKGGTVLRLTDTDAPVTISGDGTYVPDNSLQFSAITTTANNGIQSTNCNVLFSPDGIDEVDVIRGLYDNAAIELCVVDWSNPSLGKLILMTGNLSVFTVTDKKTGQFEVKGKLTRGDARIGEYYTYECRADLGDSRCKVDLSTVTTTGAVVSTLRDTIITVTLADTPTDGFYSFGVIKFTSGNNSGINMEVLQQVAAGGGQYRLTLALAMPFPVEAADEFDLVAGCQKTPEICKNKFNNIVNYRGELFVPGADMPADYKLT